MRESRESVVAMAVAKVRREGVLALLREGPVWLANTVLRSARLAALRRLRAVSYRRSGMVAVPTPEATIEIDPAAITHAVPLSRFGWSSPHALLGSVRSGDWDRNLPRIEDQPKYRACAGRVAGTPWEATGILDRLVEELATSDADAIEHGCNSREALRERYETEREALYLSLRQSGYDRTVSPVCCRIHVGRNGSLLFGTGGRHRLYLSRLLDVESVPVQVLCRHSEWQRVRDAVATANSRSELSPDVQQYLDHPDLREFPLARQATAEKLADGSGE